MSALSYFLERAGLLTTGISLVRENTESLRPPRALWVSFPLGRPLGVPADPDFQHRVIAAALDLLQRDRGPVLQDFPEDVPTASTGALMACPVSFAQPAVHDGAWTTKLAEELAMLRPWYDLASRRRKRSVVGVSSETPETNMRTLGLLLDGDEAPEDIPALKHALEDLKIFYLEAMTAQPGEYDPERLQRILWQETQLGAALLALFTRCQNADNPQLQMFARVLAPREAVGGATGPAQSSAPGGFA